MIFWFILSYSPFAVISFTFLTFVAHISLDLVVVAGFVIDIVEQHLEQLNLLAALLFDQNRFSWQIELVDSDFGLDVILKNYTELVFDINLKLSSLQILNRL